MILRNQNKKRWTLCNENKWEKYVNINYGSVKRVFFFS